MFKSFNRTSTVFYSLILISVILITLLLVLTQQISVKDLVTVSLLPLVSTFIGATLAFQLNLYRDNLLEEKRRQTAFNRSLFILFRQINAVSSLASKLSEYDSNLTLAFNCPAFKPPEYSDLKQKFEDLEFILDFDPNLLMELTIEQECFEQLMASLNLRNDFYISEVQPAIERLQLNRRQFTQEELKGELGERIYGAAMSSSANLSSHVSQSQISLPSAISKLHAAAKKMYPASEYKFICYVAK